MDTYNFSNVIKNKFLENFTNSIEVSDVVLTMFISLVFALIVFYVYKLTCDNVVYSKKFNVTMSLMAIVTTAVVMSMQANVVVSLGMVGALSIVRFRTAIKEPKDLLFLFWAISNGIIIGAGVYSIVCILALVLTLGLILFERLPGNNIPYLLVVSLKELKDEENLVKLLSENKLKFKVKSKNITSGRVDIVYEVVGKNVDEFMTKIEKNSSIISSNLISQDGECQF